MGKFSKYKVNCTDLPELMAREHGNERPSEKDTEEFFRILQKDEMDISDVMKAKIQKFVLSTVEYDRHSLSTSIKKILCKHYAYSQYGASKLSKGGQGIIHLEKGEAAEPDAIKLLSERDGVEYVKNEKMYSNRWLKGIPDIVITSGDKVIGVKDVKIPLDLPSYMERFDGDVLKDDRWQMLAYLDVLGLQEGEVVYCLVDMPQYIIDARVEYYRTIWTEQGISPQNISKSIKQLEISMKYDYIPEELKIARFTVTRRGYFTKAVHERVKLVRDRLNSLHEKFNKSGLILVSNQEPLESIS